MDNFDYWVLMVYLGLLIIIALLNYYRKEWKRKYKKAVDVWSTECDRKEKLIEKPENELKALKGMERVVKFESVVSQPIELECKFQVQEELIDHTDLFKRLCVSEAARYLAEEIERQPTLYRLLFEKNTVACCENVRMRFRLLPYPEGAIWDLEKERCREYQFKDRIAVPYRMGWEKININRLGDYYKEEE